MTASTMIAALDGRRIFDAILNIARFHYHAIRQHYLAMTYILRTINRVPVDKHYEYERRFIAS